MKNLIEFTREEFRALGHEKANAILEPMPLFERLEVLHLPAMPREMCPYEYWIQKSKAELMQWYMNAYTTKCSCGGHGKASANEYLVKQYLDLMKKYNVPIPPNDVTHILGNFNGKGST